MTAPGRSRIGLGNRPCQSPNIAIERSHHIRSLRIALAVEHVVSSKTGDNHDDFDNIDSDPVLGEINDREDLLIQERLTDLAPIRRLLARADEEYLGRLLLRRCEPVATMRSRLAQRYADQLAREAKAVWIAKTNHVLIATDWDTSALSNWLTEAPSLIEMLRVRRAV